MLFSSLWKEEGLTGALTCKQQALRQAQPQGRFWAGERLGLQSVCTWRATPEHPLHPVASRRVRRQRLPLLRAGRLEQGGCASVGGRHAHGHSGGWQRTWLAEEWAKERQVGKDTAGGGEWVRKG